MLYLVSGFSNLGTRPWHKCQSILRIRALVQGAAGRRGELSGSGQAVTLSDMPFKHNAARPKARYRVRNWPAYEAGLKRRGDLTLWLDETAPWLGGMLRGGPRPAARLGIRMRRSRWC